MSSNEPLHQHILQQFLLHVQGLIFFIARQIVIPQTIQEMLVVLFYWNQNSNMCHVSVRYIFIYMHKTFAQYRTHETRYTAQPEH